MRFWQYRLRSVAAAAATALVVAVLPQPSAVAAQDSLVWKAPAKVERVAKPGRKPVRVRPKKKVESVPLLTLAWLVLKREKGGVAKETNALSTFYTGDQLQLQFTANQPGYLYIISQSEAKDGTVVDPPTLIFPNSRINEGQNFVQKDQKFIVPSTCAEFGTQSEDCWLTLSGAPGREVFIVILSRDMITQLPNQIVSGGAVSVSDSQINQLKLETGQVIKRTSRPSLTPDKGGGAGRFVTWVTNTNMKDNEELIETIVLQHEDRPVS